jgi:3',5'-cyclic AMP phosphodiesterase CpdA
VLVAHITDLHVTPEPDLFYGRIDTRAALARMIERIEGLEPRPDLVVATGDLVDKPSPESYAALRRLFERLTPPLKLLPGNHDDRALLASAFREHAYLDADLVNYVVDYEAFRLVAFDAVVEGKEYARPTVAALDWLRDRLAEAADRPTMMIMHHPPMDTGMGFIDAFQGRWPPELAGIVRASPQIRLILCGHAHRHIDATLGAARVCVAGGSAYQFALATGLETPPHMVIEPPSLRLHLWRAGEVVSHLVPVDAGLPRIPFKGVDDTTWPAMRDRLKPRLQR